MDLPIFIKAIVIGFSISIPVGPIGVLCITHSLNRGRVAGFVSGFGATVADTVMAIIVAVGATVVTNFFIQHNFWIGLIGGLILFVVAANMLLEKKIRIHHTTIAPITSKGLIPDFFLSFFLAITNPLNVIFSAAIFIKLFTMGTVNVYQSIVIVLGIFLGSAGWWFALSNVAGSFKESITHEKIFIINKVAGGIFLALAIWFIVQSLLTVGVL